MEKIEVSIFEPLEKQPTVVINVYEIPRVGDKIKILSEDSLRVDFEFKVDTVLHLCGKNSHIPALHCTRIY